MIEWVPIKEFISGVKDEDEEFLFYDTINSRAVTTSTDTIIREGLLQSFTHAARINKPVEKTLEEKFIDHYESMNGKEYTVGSMLKCLSEIAKEHYEGKE
jgi:hypothetical protein